MRRSTLWKNKKEFIKRLSVGAFWLLVWQALSVAVGQEMLLASPAATLRALFDLFSTADTYRAIGGSFVRIFSGFALGMALGALLATLSYRFGGIKVLLLPAMQGVKAMPVASFVILLLVWFGSGYLSLWCCFLMVLPVCYINLLKGFEAMDPGLLEMARVFRIRAFRRARYLYLPHLMPFILSALSLSLGLCWKAGVAAEVIGLPNNSIGAALYESKIFLDTPDLFAWTLTILVISWGFERIMMRLIRAASRRMEGE